jgi:hypothetical protein
VQLAQVIKELNLNTIEYMCDHVLC